MLKYFKYLSYIIRHKWFVLIECCKMDIVWLGIIHDWSKLRPSEFFPYAEYFYGKNSDEDAFDFAWLLHQKRNKHYWQWFLLPEDNGGTKVLPMYEQYRVEMLCDWVGAGKALGTPDTKKWYQENKTNIQLHPETRGRLEGQLYKSGEVKAELGVKP